MEITVPSIWVRYLKSLCVLRFLNGQCSKPEPSFQSFHYPGWFTVILTLDYDNPLVLKHGSGKSPMNGGL